MSKILIIDDEKNIIRTMKTFLEIKGHDVHTADSFEKGYMNFRKGNPEIVILDVFLKGRNGVELLSLIHREKPYVPVIMISGQADIATAVESIKRGAWDFIEKPINTERLGILLGNAARQYNLAVQADVLKSRWEKDNFFIGSSQTMAEAVRLAEKAAPTDLNVLIYGKNGTGKELLAYYIYLCSSRMSYPFITINCAAIPDGLFESELFGYKKGAFTGANTEKSGYFLKADKGTLFLDEISEIPVHLQAKLLRVIEYKEVQQLGNTKHVKVDVRIITATNTELENEVSEGRFREDLYYRLNQVPIELPDLSSRREDIPGFIRMFKEEIEKRSGLDAVVFSDKAIAYLQNREYKGNIRELHNLIERLIILSNTDVIDIETVKQIDKRKYEKNHNLLNKTQSLKDAKTAFETEYIRKQLEKYNYSVKDTANAIGLLPNNLSRIINRLRIGKIKKLY